MRRYGDEVEVRVHVSNGSNQEPHGGSVRGAEPAQFLWRGRLWKVRTILARWVDTPPWWTGSRATAVTAGAVDPHPGEVPQGPEPRGPVLNSTPAHGTAADPLVTDREWWRVEAGDRGGWGVFDLALDHRDGHWELTSCAD